MSDQPNRTTTASLTNTQQSAAGDTQDSSHAVQQLRTLLAEPAYRQRADFPEATEDALVALATPPHYTPCPNPFLPEVFRTWQDDRPPVPTVAPVDPTFDLPTGHKTGLNYTLHTYHSKLPVSTLATLIDHFCLPGDVVLDPFCGSGVTGVACAQVQVQGKPVRAVLSDLSPAATFITYNYLAPADPAQVQVDGEALLAELEPLFAALYTDAQGPFDYTIYSDLFLCSGCATPFTFWDAMVEEDGTGAFALRKTLRCPACDTVMRKRRVRRQQATWTDPLLHQPVTQGVQVPVARKYGRVLRPLAPAERGAATRVNGTLCAAQVPIHPWPDGANCSQPKRSHGITHLHHLFTERNLVALSHLWARAGSYVTHRHLRFAITAFLLKTGSRLHNIGFKQGNINLAGQLPNTYYLPNLTAERHIGQLFADRLKGLVRYYAAAPQGLDFVISTGSATALDLPDNSVDYCLTDPPFGDFVHYGELNVVWEAWLGVMTNRETEAVIYAEDGKDPGAYQTLMAQAFREIYRVLKPGKWLTLVFHNSKNEIWRTIQEALQQAGFVIGDVRAARRGQGSYKQMTAAQALQSDLLVSAYKPVASSPPQGSLQTGDVAAVWTFVREQLAQLPLSAGDDAEQPVERQRHLLYDRVVADHVQRGVGVPLSVGAFYQGLQERFIVRDGMVFLPPGP